MHIRGMYRKHWSWCLKFVFPVYGLPEATGSGFQDQLAKYQVCCQPGLSKTLSQTITTKRTQKWRKDCPQLETEQFFSSDN